MRSKSRKGAVSVPSMSKSMARGRISLSPLERLMRGCRNVRSFIAAFILAMFALSEHAPAATWFDSNWKFRRPIEAIWDAEHGSGEQLCFATFYTAGHAKPNGEDLRVA